MIPGPVCPECRAGKHANCDTQAWDNDTDQPTTCRCWLSDDAHSALAKYKAGE